MRHYSYLTIFSIIPLFLWVTFVQADNDNPQKLLNLSLEDLMDTAITTASKYEEKLADTPATVIVINKQQIQQRRYINLVDLLQDLPGIDLQRGTKSSAYHNIALRGHVNNKFLILQDGVRIDSPTRDRVPIADNFPLYHAKQVEILYGAASTLYGADAFAGVINIITENGAELEKNSVTVQSGSYGYKYYQLQAGGKLGDYGNVLIGGHIHQSDMANLAKYYPREYQKVNAVNFSGQTVVPAQQREDFVSFVKSNSLFGKVNLGSNLTLGFNHSFFRSPTTTGDKPEVTLFLTESQWNTQIDHVYLNYHYDLRDNLSSKTLLQYGTYEVTPNSKYRNVYGDFHDGYKYAKGTGTGAEQQLTYRFNASQNFIGGIRYEKFYALNTPDLPLPYDQSKSPGEQNMYYPNTGNTIPIQMSELNYHQTALYLQWQSLWNEQFSTTTGVRYEKSSSYKTVVPRLGLVYRIQPSTIFKLSYGEGFRAPTIDEVTGVFGSFTGKQNAKGEYISNQFRATNFNLQPEKVRDINFNLSQVFSPNFTVSLDGYFIESDNLISTRRETTPRQFIPGANILRTTVKDNLGKAQQYGADVVANYQIQWTSNVKNSWWGNYSFIDGSVKDGNIDVDLPYIAQHKLKLGSTLSYQDIYFATAQFFLIGRTNTELVNAKSPTKRLQSPGYGLLNLRFGANTPLSGLSINLDIVNVLDRRYYNAGGSATTTFVAMPQQPRTWWLSLRYDF